MAAVYGRFRGSMQLGPGFAAYQFTDSVRMWVKLAKCSSRRRPNVTRTAETTSGRGEASGSAGGARGFPDAEITAIRPGADSKP
jgi:hypothetical protein